MISSFTLISAAVILLAIGLLVPTLLRTQRIGAEDRQQFNVEVARDRLRELQAEHDRGELSDEEFGQARKDLDIALAQDLTVPSDNEALKDSGRAGLLTLAGLLVAVPLIVGITYFQVGTPEALGVSGQEVAQAQQAVSGHNSMPPLNELVEKLEQQLQQAPDNPDGWFLLGRTYMNLSRYDDAVRAYRRLDGILPGNSQIQIALADALSMQNGGRVPEDAVSLLQDVHEREPDNVIALWLLGNSSQQQGNDRAALDYWARAYPLLEDEPSMQAEMRSAITELESRSGLSANIVYPETLPSIMGGDPAPVAAPAPEPEPATGPGITVEVALDAELLDQADPGETVFVYAKAASGPPMPLAVARKRVADLPIRVRLTDDMAMMPQMKLSAFPRVKVGARISRSGQAIAQSGDLQSSEVETANDSEQAVQLLIDSRRP